MHTSIRGLIAATLLASFGLIAGPAFAQDVITTEPTSAPPPTDPPAAITITGNVSLVTDYRFRGVSLSGGDPAIQGGITVTHKSGFYAGTWASSIHDDTGIFGDQELDLFGGWSSEVTPGITVDAGLLYYVYPSGHIGDANYFEPYASVAGSVGPAKLKLGAAYAWHQDSLGGDDNLYIFGNADIGIPTTPLTVSAHLGYTNGVLAPPYLAGSNDDTGFDYSLGRLGNNLRPAVDRRSVHRRRRPLDQRVHRRYRGRDADRQLLSLNA